MASARNTQARLGSKHRTSTSARGRSADNTIFLEAEIVHGFIYRLLYLFPVRSPLDELVDVLHSCERASTAVDQKGLPLACRPLRNESRLERSALGPSRLLRHIHGLAS